MKKGCLLGTLKKGMSSYSSPIMLIPRKLTGIPRIVTDFRHLNSRLVTLQPSIPLVRDAIQILGASGCEVLSLADLRDVYHTLRLSKKSQKYCGITPYYGSDSYLYQRLGMGLSVSPAIWQNFIQKVLQEIPNYEEEMSRNMEKCMEQQQKLAQLVEGLGMQLSQLQINPVPNVAGKDFPTPGGSQIQGLSPMPNHQFRIQTDLDLGKFSGLDLVPTNELTFEQWLSDIRAYQRQFPEFVLLPAVRKSIQGRA